MAIKTFNIDEQIHKEYSKYCKKEGLSMSKKIENFIKLELEKIRKIDTKASIKETNSKNIETNAQSIEPNTNSFRKYC